MTINLLWCVTLLKLRVFIFGTPALLLSFHYKSVYYKHISRLFIRKRRWFALLYVVFGNILNVLKNVHGFKHFWHAFDLLWVNPSVQKVFIKDASYPNYSFKSVYSLYHCTYFYQFTNFTWLWHDKWLYWSHINSFYFHISTYPITFLRDANYYQG